MGMDLDYLAARQALDKLEEILTNTDHGKRKKIADLIIKHVEQIEQENSTFADTTFTKPTPPVKHDCYCHACIKEFNIKDFSGLFPFNMTRMVLCPICHNKRCPHANDHRNECTNSNEPNQPGSRY